MPRHLSPETGAGRSRRRFPSCRYLKPALIRRSGHRGYSPASPGWKPWAAGAIANSRPAELWESASPGPSQSRAGRRSPSSLREIAKRNCMAEVVQDCSGQRVGRAGARLASGLGIVPSGRVIQRVPAFGGHKDDILYFICTLLPGTSWRRCRCQADRACR